MGTDHSVYLRLYGNNESVSIRTSFCICKEHPCPLSTDSGLLRMLEVSDWVLDLDLNLNMVTGL